MKLYEGHKFIITSIRYFNELLKIVSVSRFNCPTISRDKSVRYPGISWKASFAEYFLLPGYVEPENS